MRLALVRSVIALALVTSISSASAQIRTVLVSPVPGNSVASGTALRNAINGIAAPSSTNRWLVKIEPGIYDIGAVSLQMRSFVDLEGSGIDATTIRGSVDAGDMTAATIRGVNNTELRFLTVTATLPAGGFGTIAVYNESAPLQRYYRVKIVTQSSIGGVVWGMRNFASAPLIEECEFAVSVSGGGNTAYGIVYRSLVEGGQRSSILRSKIHVSGASLTQAVFMTEAQTVTSIRDSRIDAVGGAQTHGLYASGGFWQGTESLTVRDTEISSAGTTLSSGITFESGSAVTLEVFSSKVWGHIAPTTYGIRQNGNAPMGIQGSSVLGFTGTVESLSSVSISSTGLTGGPISVAGWLGCMGVWDENGVFYANSCPQ